MGPAWLLFAGCGTPIENRDVTVIIANGDLYPGIPITEADLAAVPIPPEHAPDGITDPTDIIGRVPFERILANETIREERLVSPGIGSALLLAPGTRGVVVPTGGILLQIGDTVDATVRLETEQLSIAKALRVVVVDPGGAAVIELPWDEAETLVHAINVGEVTITRSNVHLPSPDAPAGVDPQRPPGWEQSPVFRHEPHVPNHRR